MEYPVSSIYYMHPNENPALVLVQPVLDTRNYHAWARSFKMALLSKNKDSFINGTLEVPDVTHKDFAAWNQCNNMVLRWIMNSVSTTIAGSIMWMDKACDAWKDLRDRFANGNVFKLTDLFEELYTIKQGELSVNEYYTKIKTLWEELLILRPLPNCECNPKCSCGAVSLAKTNYEADCVITFVKGLNDSFLSVKSQVPLMTPLPSVSKVFGMALKSEFQMSGGVEQPITHDVNAVQSRTFGRGMQPQGYNNYQNSGRFGTTQSGNSNRRFQCTFCGRSGHTIERCYQKNGFPPGVKGRGRGEARINQAFVEDDGTGNLIRVEESAELSSEQINQVKNLLRMMQMGSASVAQDQGTPAEQATVLSAKFSGAVGDALGPCIPEDDWIS